MDFQAPALKRVKTGDPSLLSFRIPPMLRDGLAALIVKGQKYEDWYSVTIKLPRRPRTTGDKSQNHRINGFIQQIAAATGNGFEAVKMYLKTEAISEGWPCETLPNGTVVPKSESEASVEEASILIGTIERFAAEWGIRLEE